MTNRGPNIQLYSGKPFYILDPSPDDVCIEDIAHSLALICRFNGHCEWHYSVAQHSVIVSYMVPKEHALQALLHDGEEYVMGDKCTPLKSVMPDYCLIAQGVWTAIANRFGVPFDLHPSVKQPDYCLIAQGVWTAIANRFGVPFDLHPSVKQADRDILYYERMVLMADSDGTDWGDMVDPKRDDVPPIHNWDWEYAEVKFLQRFEELGGR